MENSHNTTERLQYIKCNIDKLSWVQMAKHLGMNAAYLSDFAKQNGITKTKKSMTNADIEKLKLNINLKSWPELSVMFNYSDNGLKKICVKHGIKKEIWAQKKIKDRIEKTRTFNKNWVIEGGGSDSKVQWMLNKWKNKNGDIDKKHILMFNNGLNTYEDLIIVERKKIKQFLRHRIVRIREQEWSKKQNEPVKRKMVKTLVESVGSALAVNKVPVRINHKTVRFVDIDKCTKNEMNQWILK
jgi:hypothetical protein